MAMEWLSLAEIAERVGVAEATARRYAAMLADFIPCQEADGASLYPLQAVEIFRRMARADTAEKLDSAADLGLGEQENRSQPPALSGQGNLESRDDSRDLANTLGQLMESVSKCLVVIADQKAVIDDQREDIRRLKSGFVMLARKQKKLDAQPLAQGIPQEEIEEVVRRSLTGREEQLLELQSREQELQQRAEQLEQEHAESREQTRQLGEGCRDMRSKLDILEAELVRLRKDRREMEKHLNEKIRRIKEEG
jgi:chromosome segregation ATPase